MTTSQKYALGAGAIVAFFLLKRRASAGSKSGPKVPTADSAVTKGRGLRTPRVTWEWEGPVMEVPPGSPDYPKTEPAGVMATVEDQSTATKPKTGIPDSIAPSPTRQAPYEPREAEPSPLVFGRPSKAFDTPVPLAEPTPYHAPPAANAGNLGEPTMTKVARLDTAPTMTLASLFPQSLNLAPEIPTIPTYLPNPTVTAPLVKNYQPITQPTVITPSLSTTSVTKASLGFGGFVKR